MKAPWRNHDGRISRFVRASPARAGIGGAIVLGAVVLAVIGPAITPYNPTEPSQAALLPPSGAHWMGTDASGFDVMSVVLAGFRVDVTIAAVSIGISLIIGVWLGAIAGYGFNENRVAGWFGWGTLRLLDFVQTIPVFILALALVGALGAAPQILLSLLLSCSRRF